MTALKISTLLPKSLKELVAMRKELRTTLFELKMKHVMRSLEHTHLIRLAKRNIARINTAISSLSNFEI